MMMMIQESSLLAQYGQMQRTTTTCGKTKDGINHQYAEQLKWCILGEIIKRKPEIVAIIGDCTLYEISRILANFGHRC